MPDTETDSTTPSLSQELDAIWDAGQEPADTPDTAPEDSDGEASEDAQPEVDATDADDEPKFTVKVRGENQEVTLDELLKGYQRQSDYTKSKQEVAQERAEAQEALNLFNALREDPQGTLSILAEHLIGTDTESQDIDPLQQRLDQHDQFIAQQQEREMLSQIDAELSRLASQYDGFDGEAVLDWAVNHNQPDLEAAWLKMQVEQSREAELTTRNKAAAARKKSAPPVAGRSTAAGSQAKPPRNAKTIAEAIAFAEEDLGTDWFGK